MQTEGSLAHALLLSLEPLQSQIKEWHCRVAPSAFNSTDPALRAVPLASEWRWPSCEEHMRRFSPGTLILQLPSFWQLEPFVYTAARGAEAPVCIIEPQNYPLDKASIRLASANAILAEATEASAIAEYLHAGDIELPPYWMLVYAADAPHWDTPRLLKNRNLEVAEEVHLTPGVPLLVQCAAIVTAQSGQYHQSDFFIWNDEPAHPPITTKNSLLFTLANFALPFALSDKGACLCGKRSLVRSY